MDREVMYDMQKLYHLTKRRGEFVVAVKRKHPTVRVGQLLAAWEAFDVCAELDADAEREKGTEHED